MIEIKVTLSCEECGEETYLSDMDLEEIANFRDSMVACWGLRELPDGWEKEYDEIYCQNCKNN